MANYKAVASGNWSNLAIWQDNSSGSFVASTVLPGAADVVYWNNFTVAIDQNVTVLQIRNDSTTGVTAGGTGTISTSRTINADLYHFSTFGSLIIISATSPSVVNINGNIPGTVAAQYSIAVNMTGNATLNFVGNVCAGLVAGQVTNLTGIQVSTGGTLNLTGNVSGGANNYSLSQLGTGVGIRTGINSTINIVGNVDSGAGSFGSTGVYSNTTATINITGNVTGNAGGGSGIYSNGGIYLASGTSLCSIIGNVTANAGGYGIYADENPVKIVGNLTNSSNGTMAFRGGKLFLEQPTQWQFRKTDLSTITLYTPGVATGFPATNNVRTGITYGPTNNLTGTCAVPPANAVSVGVPVDNTVGTAQLDANALASALNTSLQASLPAPISASLQASLPTPISASLSASLPTPIATALDTSLSASLPAAIAPLLWDEDVSNITTPNSIGERLKNCATVATTGAQISSFNP